MVMNRRIAIIPARGGSKRIPNKNIIDFNGMPIIDWTIKAALDSNLFDQVLVSTDSERIAEVSISAGASVPFLRLENHDDFASVSQATLGALNQAEMFWDVSFNTIVQLMPNCPLRNYQHIKSAVMYYESNDIEFLVSCFAFGWMNPWWAVKLDENSVPQKIFPETYNSRSQDLERLFCPSGAIWIAKREALMKSKTFYGPGHRFFPIDWKAALDIDDMDDYQMALSIASRI